MSQPNKGPVSPLASTHGKLFWVLSVFSISLPETSGPLVAGLSSCFFNRVAFYKAVCRHAYVRACVCTGRALLGIDRGLRFICRGNYDRNTHNGNRKSIPGSRSSEVKAALVMQMVCLDGYKSCRLRLSCSNVQVSLSVSLPLHGHKCLRSAL